MQEASKQWWGHIDIQPDHPFFHLQFTVQPDKNSGTKSSLVYYIFSYKLQLAIPPQRWQAVALGFVLAQNGRSTTSSFPTLPPEQVLTFPREDTKHIYLLHTTVSLGLGGYQWYTCHPLESLSQSLSTLVHCHPAYVHCALLCHVFLFTVPPCSVSSSHSFQILLTKFYLFSVSDSACPKTGFFIWSPCLLYVQFSPVLLSWQVWSPAQKIFFFSLLTNCWQVGKLLL